MIPMSSATAVAPPLCTLTSPDLLTPALLLDRPRLERNVQRLKTHLHRLGVPLRPHVKTTKCRQAMALALAGEPGGVAVSTMKEAEEALGWGVRDILYAVGITPAKLDQVAALRRRGADLVIVLDSEAQARAVVARGAALNERFPVLLEIDSDGHRAGLEPQDPALVAIGRILAEGGAELRGVMAHAGGSYHCTSTDAIVAMAERERAAAVNAAQALRGAGMPAPVVSVGSTPTATFAESLDGVTEVRAGVFMCQDLVMAGIGVCTLDDIAVSVLTSVIGHQRARGWVLIDAGWMALSRDRGTARQRIDQGFGGVCDVDGRVLPELIVTSTNQEHGVVARRDGATFDVDSLPVGARLRILPNHACATGAAHDRYHVIAGSRLIEAVWPRFRGW